MHLGVFLLVMASALLHASWNATLRDVKGNAAVMTLARYLGSCLALLVASADAACTGDWSGFSEVLTWSTAGLCCLSSAAVHTAYQLLLVNAYEDGDLSIIYPVARGSGVAITAVLSLLCVGEDLSLTVRAGIFAVVSGILLVGLSGVQCAAKTGPRSEAFLLPDIAGAAPGASIESPIPAAGRVLRQALKGVCIGAVIAAYQVVDKRGVVTLSSLPIAYTGLMSLLSTVLSHGVSSDAGCEALRAALAEHRRHICLIGSASMTCYCIVTYAMQVAPVAIVGALRESSVLFGAILGVVCFKEPCNALKTGGVALILIGMLTVKLG